MTNIPEGFKGFVPSAGLRLSHEVYFLSLFLEEVSDFDFSAAFEDFSSFFEAGSSLGPDFSFELESPFEEDAVAEDFLA